MGADTRARAVALLVATFAAGAITGRPSGLESNRGAVGRARYGRAAGPSPIEFQPPSRCWG